MNFLEWWYGLAGLSIGWAAIYFFVSTHLTFVAITLYLHRHSAHRSLDLHPAVAHVFRFILWISTGMITKEWTAVHRKHHAKTETDEDPHSPVIHGLSAILFQGVEYYRDAITDETIRKYGKGTPNDWIERNLYSKHTILGVALYLIIALMLFGIVGLIVWTLQMMWTPFFAAGVVNGIGHAIGYRNFESPDQAKNISPIGIIIVGEELHNNHHTYPNSARFSFKPWEFDLGWMYIQILAFLKLARPLHTGPIVKRVSGKSQIDMDTLWAVVNDRFRVMARYAEKVVKPEVKAEKRTAQGHFRRLLKRADKAFVAHDLVLKDRDRNNIVQVTQRSPVLKQIYDLRVGLTKIWAQRTGSGEELLADFREWCHKAEQTGVESLRQFVKELKTYTVPQST